MDIRIIPEKISGKVNIPSSKSVLHRLLIASCFCKAPTEIKAVGYGRDIAATIDCLRALGAKISVNGNLIKVFPIVKVNQTVTLNVEESGSTLRFLLPIAAALGVNASFNAKSGLIARPIADIVGVLKKGGIEFSRDSLPFTISGKLKSGNYSIDGSVSSQFITGLLFALSLVEGNSTLNVTNDSVSTGYIDLTLSILDRFGVSIEKSNPFVIEGNGKFIGGISLEAEGDWSSACFMIGLAALSGKIELYGLDTCSRQSDRIILELLDKMKIKYFVEKADNTDFITVEKSKIFPIELSVKNCPDIAPVIAILLANAEGESVIRDVDRLSVKESDRLKNIIEMLSELGIESKYSDDSLTIYGRETKLSRNIVILDGRNDHRMALSSIIALSKIGGIVRGVECIEKSYPSFLKEYAYLGGKYEVLK